MEAALFLRSPLRVLRVIALPARPVVLRGFLFQRGELDAQARFCRGRFLRRIEMPWHRTHPQLRQPRLFLQRIREEAWHVDQAGRGEFGDKQSIGARAERADVDAPLHADHLPAFIDRALRRRERRREHANHEFVRQSDRRAEALGLRLIERREQGRGMRRLDLLAVVAADYLDQLIPRIPRVRSDRSI